MNTYIVKLIGLLKGERAKCVLAQNCTNEYRDCDPQTMSLVTFDPF